MKNVFLFFSALMISYFAFAQDATSKSPEQRAGKYVKQLEKELNLNAEQSSKIEAIQLKCIKQIDEIKSKDESGSKKEQNKESKEVMNTANADIKAVLTDEQKVKFEAWLEQKKQKAKNKDGEKEKNGREN